MQEFTELLNSGGGIIKDIIRKDPEVIQDFGSVISILNPNYASLEKAHIVNNIATINFNIYPSADLTATAVQIAAIPRQYCPTYDIAGIMLYANNSNDVGKLMYAETAADGRVLVRLRSILINYQTLFFQYPIPINNR